jgi:hypothetical protein
MEGQLYKPFREGQVKAIFSHLYFSHKDLLQKRVRKGKEKGVQGKYR